jgi:uncharacterized membrane protein YfcA
MLLAIPFGLAIGLAVGMLGGGGSVLAVPVLVYVIGQTVPEATTTSLLVVAAGAIAGSVAHARAGRVCWRHAGSFTAAAIPGIAAGTLVAEHVGGRLLLAAFALVMVAAAHAMWRRAELEEPEPDGPWERTGACPPLRLPRDLAAGAGVGFVTGLFGVGGGFLVVPALAIALAFTMRTAVGTSLVITTATSLLGLGAHLAAGRHIDAGVAIAMTAACVAGSLAGVRLASAVSQRGLARGFCALVLAIAAYLLVSVAFLGGPPTAQANARMPSCSRRLKASSRDTLSCSSASRPTHATKYGSPASSSRLHSAGPRRLGTSSSMAPLRSRSTIAASWPASRPAAARTCSA